MDRDRETTWSSSLLTASSFLGLVISVILGSIAALSDNGGDFTFEALGALCAVTFVTHLRAT
jgi:hypothetical protein